MNISRKFSRHVSFFIFLNTLVMSGTLMCVAVPSAKAQCVVGNLTPVSELEKTSLVIDVRPDQINQFKGKSAFKNEARIALINMNPFLFTYTLKVDQTEVQDTGFLNFLKLLGSPVSDLLGSVSASSLSKALSASTKGSLPFLITRTAAPAAPSAACPGPQVADANAAIQQLATLRTQVLNDLDLNGPNGVEAAVANNSALYANARTHFLAQKNTIFDSSVEAAPLCTAANALHSQLPGDGYPNLDTLSALLTKVHEFQSMVEELKASALEYKTEYGDCPARANGLNYADNLGRLGSELTKLGQAYETKVKAMIDETKSYDALVKTIATINGHENRILQREYKVLSQYDISALDITATAVPLGAESGLPGKDFVPQRVVGDIQTAQGAGDGTKQANARLVNVNAGPTESAQGIKVFGARSMNLRAQAADADAGGGAKGSENGAGAKQIKTTGSIGTRRFELSAGMAFSTLDRREFQPVLGYPRNEQGEIIDPATGNPTADRKLTKIVGFGEQSSRRFAPLAMLHYRLPFARNVFASAGFTGKQDNYGVDLEYLIGPSVLYKNMFFTFGGYAGKQQKLAGDLFEGSPVDGDVPVRKDYKWGWAFSFTYKIPLGSRTPDK